MQLSRRKRTLDKISRVLTDSYPTALSGSEIVARCGIRPTSSRAETIHLMLHQLEDDELIIGRWVCKDPGAYTTYYRMYTILLDEDTEVQSPT